MYAVNIAGRIDGRPSEHHRRLLDAMAQAVARKGFAAVTIADLAAEARVSKRSFYEQFRDKADCFIALYESSSLRALHVMQQAFDRERDWHDQVETVLSAYFTGLASNPPLLSTLFIDIMAIGPAGLAARRRTTERFAQFIVECADCGLSLDRAVAIVGGLHEWVLRAVESGQFDRVAGLAPEGASLVRAVIDASTGVRPSARNDLTDRRAPAAIDLGADMGAGLRSLPGGQA